MTGLMSWFRRGKKATSGRAERRERDQALVDWVAARRGVEVFVEPATSFNEVSMVLVAADGEFHRVRTGTTAAASSFAREHALPVYDATIVGYPQRMRDYSRRQTILARRRERDAADGR
ncbi:oxidoreductase [Nakamurella flavida]|uniref:Oxidoreductase n=1 Tax=Nakamurella flavida TaxID=363630 RepID=A0A938YBZ3_9ACTN|nr:oxidoreductase [Nakamurella flavida]MBM9474845.1 oxidoreductase [Nakamurella flavida]MDP9776415.1 hypothetical protein [Nakamurella flavida]